MDPPERTYEVWVVAHFPLPGRPDPVRACATYPETIHVFTRQIDALNALGANPDPQMRKRMKVLSARLIVQTE